MDGYLGQPWNLPEDPSDDDLVEYVRDYAQTLYHPTSTCAMGSGSPTRFFRAASS